MTVWTVVLLIVGMALLIGGADLFVDGASNIAKILRIPSLIIGLTLVSIGTSLPETSVSINSIIQGLDDMSLGNVVGSDIFNILPILGVSALLVPLVIDREMKIFHIPIMMATFVLVTLFAFAITPLKIDRWEAILMVVLFIIYNIFLVIRAKKSQPQLLKDTEGNGQISEIPQSENLVNDKEVKNGNNLSDDATDTTETAKQNKLVCFYNKIKDKLWFSIIIAISGVAGIVYGGKLVVDNASTIATSLGMSEVLVGLTIVAVGTSLPEFVTSIVAAIKKENDIAIGNVVGSNIYNILLIVGLAGSIRPIVVGPEVLYDMLVMIGAGLVLALISLFAKKTKWWQGVLMVLMYVAYLTYIIIRN